MNPSDMAGLARYIPGFEFLQNLTRQAAGSAVPGAASAVPGMPPMSHWVAPTFDVEELDKRIQDLKAVHFWLDQNTKALGATIQALEVQKMTLATLKGMNLGMAEMAEAFKLKPEHTELWSAAAAAMVPGAARPSPAAAAPAPAPVSPPPVSAAAPATDAPPEGPTATGPQIDPVQWWRSLTEQFQTIATHTVQDMAQHANRAAEQVAQSVQAAAEAVTPVVPPAAAEATEPPAAPKPRRTRSSTATTKTAAPSRRKT